MPRTVNCLVDRGRVSKGENPADGRQVVVSLTEQGVAEVRETRRRRNAWLAQRLTDLTPEDRLVLARAAELLRRIAEL